MDIKLPKAAVLKALTRLLAHQPIDPHDDSNLLTQLLSLISPVLEKSTPLSRERGMNMSNSRGKNDRTLRGEGGKRHLYLFF